MKFKKLITTVSVTIIIILVGLLGSGLFRVSVKTELDTIEGTRLSFIIMDREASDEEIISMMDDDPTLIFETNFDGDPRYLECKSPLLAAITNDRIELAKEMIRRGVPTEKPLEVLKQEDYLSRFYKTLRDLVEKHHAQPTISAERKGHAPR